MYDVICSICGQQLNFREIQDKEDDTLIVVDPCSVCSQDEDSDIRGIEEYLDNYGPEE